MKSAEADSLTTPRHFVRILACVAGVLLVVGIILGLHVQPNRLLSAALNLFLILVLLASINWGTRYALLSSLLAGLAFSLSISPAGHLHLEDARVWAILSACLVTGLTASGLSARLRHSIREANDRRVDAVTEHERFAGLVNSLDGIVWEADVKTHSFSFVSEQAERILGFAPERWLNDPAFWQDHLHPEDRDRVIESRQQALAQRHDHDFEYRMIAEGGGVVWVRDLVTVVAEAGGGMRLRGVMVDITERKRTEEALRAAMDERARLSVFREELGMALAHEGNLRAILQQCAESMVRHIDAAFARIWTISSDGQELELQASAGMYTHLNGPHSRVHMGRHKIGLIAQERKPLLTNDVQNDPRISDKEWARREKMVAFAGCPLLVEDRVVGVMAMFSQKPLPGSVIETLSIVADSIAQGIERKHAEETVRKSEKELRDVIETIPAVVWSALPDGSNTYMNRRWAEYAGFSNQDPGAVRQDPVHPDDAERYLGKWERSIITGAAFEDEVRFRRAGGEYHWHLVRGVPLRDEHEKILKWYGIMSDIEDRKRVESLLAGEKRILEMVAKGGSLRAILDSLCRLVEEQTSDVRASVLLLDGNRLRHGGAPSLPKAYVDAVDGAAIGPSEGSCGTAAYRGEQVIVEDIATDPLWANYHRLALPHSLRACWSTPVFSSQGKVIATFAMYYSEPRRPTQRDQEIIEQITHLAGVAIERQLTYEQLKRSESYLAEAQRLSRTGSWAWSPATGDIRYWSEECYRVLGFDPIGPPPRFETFFERIHPDDQPASGERFEQAIRDKADFEMDYRIVHPEKGVRDIHVVGHAVLDGSNNLDEFVGTVIDVTQPKRAEQERERLRELEAEISHINRVTMMGELAASLAHEIKQPIAAAITSANACLRWLARDPPDLERARAAAVRIEQDGTRAAEVINSLRSFYKKGSPDQRVLLDVNEIIREMAALLHNEATRYSISIQPRVSEGIPQVMADRVQLQQILMNLMLNAIDAMKDTTGELTVMSGLNESGHVLVSVSDTGVGLPAKNLDHIFDAFFTTKPQGTGMGLAITRSIVESYGGQLWATANSVRGATFHFTLPKELAAHA